MSETHDERKGLGAAATTALAAMAVIFSAGALIVAVGSDSASGTGTPPMETSSAAGQDHAPVNDDAATSASAPDEISVSLSEFAISSDADTIGTGTQVTVVNDGAAPHDLVVDGTDLATPQLMAGDTAVLDFSAVEPGVYEWRCSIPGHDTAGMTGKVTVSEGGATIETADDAGGHHADDEVDWAAMDLAMAETINAFPAATDGLGNQLLEPEDVLEDGTKVFRMVAQIFDWEIEPGVIVEGWGYNGQIPGPMIHLDVGDKVQIHIENELPMGTDVHWHGVLVPNNQDGVAPLTQPLIQPGETYTYEFVTREPAIGMYHPHHHGQMKLPNGMFGAFIIGDLGDDIPLPSGTIGGRIVPEDLEIAQEIPMVLNDAGTIGLSLNGKSFPATEPIVADQGDWIVVHYYNEGLQIHPMHLHQMPQLVFAKDGFPLDAPQWEDTVNVAPGERYSVLIPVTDPGVWVWHCHILTHAERHEGMFGMVTALIVD